MYQHFLPDFYHVLETGVVVVSGGGSGQIFFGDFLEGQESVPLGTVINESRFQRGFDTGDFTFVNIGFFLCGIKSFNIKVVELLAVNQRDTQFFLLGRVYKHSFHYPGSATACRDTRLSLSKKQCPIKHRAFVGLYNKRMKSKVSDGFRSRKSGTKLYQISPLTRNAAGVGLRLATRLCHDMHPLRTDSALRHADQSRNPMSIKYLRTAAQ